MYYLLVIIHRENDPITGKTYSNTNIIMCCDPPQPNPPNIDPNTHARRLSVFKSTLYLCMKVNLLKINDDEKETLFSTETADSIYTNIMRTMSVGVSVVICFVLFVCRVSV